MKRIQKKYWIPLVIIVILIGIRIALPYIVKDYVNKTLQNLDGYTGSVADIDINLYRGAYVIDSLVIQKLEGNNPVPFVSIQKIDLSVEWGALFHGAIVGEIELYSPRLNFVAEAKEKGVEGQSGDDVDWTETIKDLMPLQINRFAIINGNIHYLDYGTDPKVDLYLNNLNAEATNLNNAEDIEKDLPSHLVITAVSIGNGNLNVTADLNILKQIPDMDIDFKFENADLPAFNDFLKSYAAIDAEKGLFSLYSEIAVDSGNIDGYIKPILNKFQIFSLKEDIGDNIFSFIWQGIAGLVMEIFQNQSKDQFATKVSLSGNVEDLSTGILPAIWNVFKNAFIQAFKKDTDNEIDFTQEEAKKEDSKEKKDE